MQPKIFKFKDLKLGDNIELGDSLMNTSTISNVVTCQHTIDEWAEKNNIGPEDLIEYDIYFIPVKIKAEVTKRVNAIQDYFDRTKYALD